MVLETKTLYENQIGQWIASRLKEAQFKIDADALQILTESMGSDLSKIEKEIVKKCLSKITYWIVLGPNMKKQLEDIYQSLNIKDKSLCYSDQDLRASIARGFYSRELNDYIKRRIVEQKIITFGKEPLTIGYLSNLMEEKGIVEFKKYYLTKDNEYSE